MNPEEHESWCRPWRLAGLAKLIKIYYEDFDNTVGGSLHIVLSDGNIEDNHVKYCIQYAKDHDDPLGVAIGELLLKLTSEEERERFYESNWENPW